MPTLPQDCHTKEDSSVPAGIREAAPPRPQNLGNEAQLCGGQVDGDQRVLGVLGDAAVRPTASVLCPPADRGADQGEGRTEAPEAVPAEG